MCLGLYSCDNPLEEATLSEVVFIESGGFNLAAQIYKPKGAGPFPAVVMVHGSKNHTMDFYTEYSQYFAQNGIVTVNYDKRGHGLSGGDLWTSTFEDLAGDVVAVTEYLQQLPYVDPDRVGLWADSQGGWIILLADNLSPDIAFMINKSGPAMPPLEQIYYDYEYNYMRPVGTPEPVIDELKIWYKNVFDYLTRSRSDSLWQEIKTVIDKYESTPFLKAGFDEYYLSILGPPDSIPPRDEIILDPSGRDYDFDPIPFYRRLSTPTLVLYGEADPLVDTKKCIERLKSIDNLNIQLKVYEGADHGIRVQRKPGILFPLAFPKGYLRLQKEFIFTSTAKH